jgi:hypothetical protein
MASFLFEGADGPLDVRGVEDRGDRVTDHRYEQGEGLVGGIARPGDSSLLVLAEVRVSAFFGQDQEDRACLGMDVCMPGMQHAGVSHALGDGRLPCLRGVGADRVRHPRIRTRSTCAPVMAISAMGRSTTCHSSICPVLITRSP